MGPERPWRYQFPNGLEGKRAIEQREDEGCRARGVEGSRVAEGEEVKRNAEERRAREDNLVVAELGSENEVKEMAG